MAERAAPTATAVAASLGLVSDTAYRYTPRLASLGRHDTLFCTLSSGL